MIHDLYSYRKSYLVGANASALISAFWIFGMSFFILGSGIIYCQFQMHLQQKGFLATKLRTKIFKEKTSPTMAFSLNGR